MIVKKDEGKIEYRCIQNGIGEILMQNKFSSDDTDDRCKLVAVLNIEPGQGTGIHDHTKDIEILYVIEGELTCNDDNERKTIKQGDITVTAKGSVHNIFNESDKTAKVLALIIK